jgi:hypothetical protein
MAAMKTKNASSIMKAKKAATPKKVAAMKAAPKKVAAMKVALKQLVKMKVAPKKVAAMKAGPKKPKVRDPIIRSKKKLIAAKGDFVSNSNQKMADYDHARWTCRKL